VLVCCASLARWSLGEGRLSLDPADDTVVEESSDEAQLDA